MKMKKLNVVWLGVVTMTVFSIATAGVVQPAPVTVEIEQDGSGTASGDMLAARFSGNDVELIGCGVRKFDFGTPFTFGFCQAVDSTGQEAFCSTDSAHLLDGMARADYAFVTFSWNADGMCTRIGNSVQSFYLPSEVQSTKTKKKK